MIIFGTKGVTSTPDKGRFHCFSCGDEKPYELKRVRQFFTLYFIPMIPMKVLGEYVECQTCKDTFRPEVLGFNMEEEQAMIEAEYMLAMKQVMIHMLLADGVIEDDEVTMLCDIYRQIANSDFTEAQAREEITRVQTSGDKLEPYLETLQGVLNEEGKESVIRAALGIAFSDGEFQDEEQELIVKIGETLGMSVAHIKGIMGEMLEDD